MQEHVRGLGAFLATTVGGGVVSFLWWLLVKEPCSSGFGECAYGMTFAEFAPRAGVLATIAGLFVGWVADS